MISVVIPVYNEEENIGELHRELRSVLKPMNIDYEIIFVDDGSTDSTFDGLIKVHETDNNVRIIKFRRNFGQTAAMSAGFDQAKGEIVITMDGDLQNDPSDIPRMIKKLESEDYDVICGWRHMRKDSLPKKAISKLANILRRNLVGGLTIHDSGCTMRIYKSECLRNLNIYGEMHRYIPNLLNWKGYKIGEIKVNHRKRSYGITKYNWRRIIRGFLDLMVVAFWQKYSFRPIHIFGLMGIILGIFGAIVAMYLVIERLFFGSALAERPLFMVSIFFVILGVQFFVTGILADIMIKTYYGQNKEKNYLIERVI
jgi:glycosyltransferase involved in cell wall biosynthesis